MVTGEEAKADRSAWLTSRHGDMSKRCTSTEQTLGNALVWIATLLLLNCLACPTSPPLAATLVGRTTSISTLLCAFLCDPLFPLRLRLFQPQSKQRNAKVVYQRLRRDIHTDECLGRSGSLIRKNTR